MPALSVPCENVFGDRKLKIAARLRHRSLQKPLENAFIVVTKTLTMSINCMEYINLKNRIAHPRIHSKHKLNNFYFKINFIHMKINSKQSCRALHIISICVCVDVRREHFAICSLCFVFRQNGFVLSDAICTS